MNKKNSKVFSVLDHYLSQMEDASVGAGSIFASEQNKEWHESILMYAFRKYRACHYHFENVKRLPNQEKSTSGSLEFPEAKGVLKKSKAIVSVHKSMDKYVYELAAFLEAAKSSLDFLSTACSLYLQGINTDTVRTFIKCVDKDSKIGPVFDVFKQYLSWLKQLREYRHHLVQFTDMTV